MLIVLSPAKTLDFESPIVDLEATRPEFAADARQLIARLRELSADDLAALMTLSPALAELNVDRYAAFRA
ncbi:MAG: peroxide stress protein YaaA, partial [Burkholderiales bacterium]